MSPEVFGYHRAVIERFPAVRAEVIVVDDFDNGTASSDLRQAYAQVQHVVAGRLAERSPAEEPSIRAWRSVFSAFGVKPTQHRNAAEALLRRLHRHGEVPSINPAVDIGNLVSMSHALPVAVLDLSSVATPVRVVFADGTESFTGIGRNDIEHPEPGEVVFVDAAGRVAARRWCWKQSAHSATGPETTAVMFVIEAVHSDAASAVESAADHLHSVVTDHRPEAGGRREAINRTPPTS